MTKGLYPIVGMKHRGTEQMVAALFPGESITLRREPTNAFDTNAVQVWARKTHVGYVPKALAAILAKLMDDAGVAVVYGNYVPHQQPHVQIDESQFKGAANADRDPAGPPAGAAGAEDQEAKGQDGSEEGRRG